MDFLGHCPYELAPTWGVRLRAIRRKLLGLSREEMAAQIGIDPSTLGRIERNTAHFSRPVRKKIERSLNREGELRKKNAVSRP